MDIKITDAARVELTAMAEEGLTPRITLTKAGCCSYRLQLYGDKPRGEDQIYTCDGVDFLIDERAIPLLGYAKVDYGRNGIFKDFKVGPR